MLVRFRAETARRQIEEAEHPFAAAIADFVQQCAVAAREVLGFDQKKISREFDLASAVARRKVNVRDDLIGRVHGIDREMHFASNPFETAGQTKSAPIENFLA